MGSKKVQPVTKVVRKKLKRSLEDVRAGRVQEFEDVMKELKEFLSSKKTRIEKRRKEIEKNHRKSIDELKKGKLKFFNNPESLIHNLEGNKLSLDMTATTLRKRIHEATDKVQEEHVLKAVFNLLERAQKKVKPMKPMTVKELLARDAKSMKEFKEGRTISQEEVKRRFGITK